MTGAQVNRIAGSAETAHAIGIHDAQPQLLANSRLLWLHPGRFSPGRSYLWDQYLNRFCRTFPSYAGPQNPFLSVLVPMALQSNMLFEALIAMSGAQTWGSASLELREETLEAKHNALKACRELLNGPTCSHISRSRTERDAIGSVAVSSGSSTNGSITMDTQLIVLLATVTMLLLYEKFTGEGEKNWKPHLNFINHVFALTDIPRGSNKFNIAMCFLHGLFTYNDLVGSTSLRSAPLSTFYVQACEADPTYGSSHATSIPSPHPPLGSVDRQNWLTCSDRGGRRFGAYQFPSMIARISSGDTSLSMTDIIQWDGRMDWFPSFCLKDNESCYLANRESHEEASIIVELYRKTAMIYYEQRLLRDHQQITLSTTPLRRTAQRGHGKGGESDLPYSQHIRAIELIKLIPAHSPYENSLLWPISIIAPDLQYHHTAERQYLFKKLEWLERRFQMKQFHCMRQFLRDFWTRADESHALKDMISFSMLQG
ncbi:hypothetical protein AYO22_08439 [Fonsecaea multimorphosa]|nr:hypothetical protein AYO22_08439 [Fonsecaea multimorphosa]